VRTVTFASGNGSGAAGAPVVKNDRLEDVVIMSDMPNPRS
jgi:hypothetical protein